MKLKVEVISLEGCSAAVATHALIHEIAAEKSLDIQLDNIVVTTTDEAVRYRHLGGPTVHINGLDIEPDARNIKTYGIS